MNRFYKVSYTYMHEKQVPFIRLSGKWLEQFGFPCDTKIRLRAEPGILILMVVE